ncbi:MAG: HAMP domain-containing protein, partial [Halobaculum sp.]
MSSVVRAERTATVAAEANVQDNTIQTVVSNLQSDASSLADTTTRVRAAARTPAQGHRELSELYEQRTEKDALSAVHLIDPEEGRVLATSTPQVMGQSSSLLGYEVPPSLEQGDTIIRAQTAGTGAWVVFTRTRSGDVLVAKTPLSYVDERVASVLDESTTRIVDLRGTVVYDSRNDSAVGSQHTAGEGINSPAVRSGILGNKGAQTVSAANSTTGTELIVGYDGVEATTWAVVTYAEPGALFRVVDRVRRNLFVLLGAVAALLVGFVVAVERPALRDLTALQSDVAALRDGDLDTPVETDRRDEIGELARGLDEMRVELGEQISAARQAREEAETARTEAETAREEAEALSQHLEAKTESYREAIRQLAEGDFTVRVDPESRHEGMAAVGET